MLAELGIITTGLALVCAIFAVLASAYGAVNGGLAGSDRWVRSARNAALLTWPLLTSACIALTAAQVSGEYNIAYVYATVNNNEPLFYKLTALWGGQPGSLLFWSWMLTSFTAAAVLINWKSERRLMPWVITFTMGVLTFFLILNVFVENPFARYWWNGQTDPIISTLAPAGLTLFQPNDGKGLNPLLRHPGMVIHPPTLYAGFVGFVIPWAFGMAALASGQLNTNWIRATRRWTLVAWLFLSLGLILGGRWAYDVLGWGGYWGWDPVENSALLPWLTGTAFLHSVMIQEKRGMLKVWNLFLVILTFLLVILGTFNTRSGLVDSVHSFAKSEIGRPMLMFVALSIGISLGLWAWRWYRGELQSENRLDALLSRESMFILNNWVFLAIALMVGWGIYAPTFTEILTGQRITLGVEYYRYYVIPLFGVLYVLMGIAPLVAYKRMAWTTLGKSLRVSLIGTGLFVAVLIVAGTTPGAVFAYGLIMLAAFTTVIEYGRGIQARMKTHGENTIRSLVMLFSRNQRRYGGYFIHLGIVIIGFGAVGSTVYQQVTQQTVSPGQTITLGAYTLRYDGIYRADADDGRSIMVTNATVFKDGAEVARITPRKDFFGQGQNPMTIAGQYSTAEADFYVLLDSWAGERASFKIFLNPLINLVWWGGIILMIGTGIATWPRVEREVVPIPRRAAATVTAGGD